MKGGTACRSRHLSSGRSWGGRRVGTNVGIGIWKFSFSLPPLFPSLPLSHLHWDIITYHSIHPFKGNNSVVFTMFTELCTHHQSILEHFHHPKKRLCTYQQSLSIYYFPSPRQPLIYFLSINLPILDINVSWIIQYVASFLWLFLPGEIVSSFIQMQFHGVDIPHLLFYPFINWCTFGLFPPSDCY